MNKENVINQWLAIMSDNQWQLDDGESHFNDLDGHHYATLGYYDSRLLIMFPLPPAQQPNEKELHTQLLLLNNHPEVMGLAAFSLAPDDANIVLSLSLENNAITVENLAEFWPQSIATRNTLFDVLSDRENN